MYSYDWFCGPGSQIIKLIHLKYIATNIAINIFFFILLLNACLNHHQSK